MPQPKRVLSTDIQGFDLRNGPETSVPTVYLSPKELSLHTVLAKANRPYSSSPRGKGTISEPCQMVHYCPVFKREVCTANKPRAGDGATPAHLWGSKEIWGLRTSVL